MRYAIVSDVHANLQAWNAVLNDIRCLGVDEIICLGDIVGYGPSPGPVLESMYTHVNHFVLGNHDAAFAGKIDPESFNDCARIALDWTARQLDGKARDFLAGLPLVASGETFRCTHGDFTDPACYNYLFEAEDVAPVWERCPEPLLFVGHTHIPRLFVIGGSGRTHALDPCDFRAEEGKRYLVNVGAVGQPRDNDMRASYCLLDLDRNDLFFRRVPFDVDAYRRELAASRLPSTTTWFLEIDAQTRRTPVRERCDFIPLQKQDQRLAANDRVEPLEQAVRQVRKWRTAAVMLLLLLLATAGLALPAMLKEPLPPLTRFPALQERIQPVPHLDMPLIGAPLPLGTVSPEHCLENWSVELAAPEKQSVAAVQLTAENGNGSGFHLRSDISRRVRIISVPVQAPPGARFTGKAQFKPLAFSKGYLEIALIEDIEDGGERVLANRQAKQLEKEPKWLPASITMSEPLKKPTTVRFLLHGEFQGEIMVRKMEFFRRE